MPVSLPFSSGITLPTALAAPVDAGMMFWAAPRPSRHILALGPSTVFWVAVVACTVDMSPSTMPKLSLMTLASGAKQLVVHEALLTIVMLGLYELWFTPITNIGASAEGAEMITFLAPPSVRLFFSWPFQKVPDSSYLMRLSHSL
uniref:Putative secreted protein n=1 Tax=Ixodes ricinus TaxID=34613 RepID=A0A147BVJ1_IXORI